MRKPLFDGLEIDFTHRTSLFQGHKTPHRVEHPWFDDFAKTEVMQNRGQLRKSSGQLMDGLVEIDFFQKEVLRYSQYSNPPITNASKVIKSVERGNKTQSFSLFYKAL